MATRVIKFAPNQEIFLNAKNFPEKDLWIFLRVVKNFTCVWHGLCFLMLRKNGLAKGEVVRPVNQKPDDSGTPKYRVWVCRGRGGISRLGFGVFGP